MKRTWIVRFALAAALFIPSYAQAISIQINSIYYHQRGKLCYPSGVDLAHNAGKGPKPAGRSDRPRIQFRY